jgi:hypothetical protein
MIFIFTDIYIYGCYNYNIDYYYNNGSALYQIHNLEEIKFKIRNNYIFRTERYNFFKKKKYKYYYIENY